MIMQPVLNVILNTVAKAVHKLSAGCDNILIEFVLSQLEWLISELDLFRPLIIYLLFSR